MLHFFAHPVNFNFSRIRGRDGVETHFFCEDSDCFAVTGFNEKIVFILISRDYRTFIASIAA